MRLVYILCSRGRRPGLMCDYGTIRCSGLSCRLCYPFLGVCMELVWYGMILYHALQYIRAGPLRLEVWWFHIKERTVYIMALLTLDRRP